MTAGRKSVPVMRPPHHRGLLPIVLFIVSHASATRPRRGSSRGETRPDCPLSCGMPQHRPRRHRRPSPGRPVWTLSLP
ncbi:MAG: hypothetical protein MZV64_71200 [Ignavibacteriales bacterium]|nr:hypothetical protein [Ignavibacteriales bacterium]